MAGGVYSEIEADDAARAVGFYAKVFSWSFTEVRNSASRRCSPEWLGGSRAWAGANTGGSARISTASLTSF